MFNIGSGELALIAVVALLVLGPKRLPELARGIGKFMREFRRQTDEVRGVVEREFYKMDQELPAAQPPRIAPDAVAVGQPQPAEAPHPPADQPTAPASTSTAADGASPSPPEDALAPVTEHTSSQILRGMPSEGEGQAEGSTSPSDKS